ncbi:chromatin assembly protein [Theileria orientalis]|uniref:Chromatin assembly protein n=1 Tax=Theileria orientalis TaxID=68886 RepID=A0A976MBY2_THEOR|nr:chromatin assembly protein [Theileria orientalis]
MSLINVTNIKVGNNVCSIKLPLSFQIEFECLEDLKHDVEWKIIYITSDGSGYLNTNVTKSTDKSELGTDNSVNEELKGENTKNQEMDQLQDYLKSPNEGEIVLDAVCMGPVRRGILQFEFRVNPPNFARLRPDCILGMQAILITGSYCDQEFIRIGYYTNNTYDEDSLRENPPDVPILDKVIRCIIDQPRVTRFPIKWDNDDLVDFEGNKLNFVSEDSNDNSEDTDDDPDESNDSSDESKVDSDDEGIDDDTTYLTEESNDELEMKGDETNRDESDDYEQEETAREEQENAESTEEHHTSSANDATVDDTKTLNTKSTKEQKYKHVATNKDEYDEEEDEEEHTRRQDSVGYSGTSDEHTASKKYATSDEHTNQEKHKRVAEEDFNTEGSKRQRV